MENKPQYDPHLVKASRLIEDFFESYERELYTYISFKVGGRKSLAEDLLMDTFEQICKDPLKILSINNPTTWIFGVANKLSYRALKRYLNRNAQEISIEGLYDENDTIPFEFANSEQVYDDVIVSELLELVLGENTILTPRELEVIRSSWVEELSISEISVFYGITERTVKNTLSNARKKIRILVAQKWDW